MSDRDKELMRHLYGLNWAALGSREQAFKALSDAVTEGFEMHLSAEIGGRVIRGLTELKEFAEALEQDFEDCVYAADEIAEGTEGRVLVAGTINAKGRASKLPLSGEFGHVWTLRDGRATRADSYRDRDAARRAAGL